MKKVLVVDDEADIADAIRAILETEGYQVEIARDGVACLQRLAVSWPDLMLLDIMMPGLDGCEVLDAIKERNYQFPVVMMSAVRVQHRLAQYPVSAFLRKPFQLDTLLDTVSDCIGQPNSLSRVNPPEPRDGALVE